MKIMIAILFLFYSLGGFTQTSGSDSAHIRNTIMSFYNWYVDNHQRLNTFELYKGEQSDNTPPYKMNWPEVDRYFSYIRTSVPWLGEAFIVNQRNFFRQCDSAFRADPDGEIPFGFDFDWYTDSQEDPGWLIDELKNATRWMINVKGNDAVVDVYGNYNDNGTQTEALILCYAMKKEKGKWKIARISCPYSKY